MLISDETIRMLWIVGLASFPFAVLIGFLLGTYYTGLTWQHVWFVVSGWIRNFFGGI